MFLKFDIWPHFYSWQHNNCHLNLKLFVIKWSQKSQHCPTDTSFFLHLSSVTKLFLYRNSQSYTILWFKVLIFDISSLKNYYIFLDIPDHRFTLCIYQAWICSEAWYETNDQWERSTFNAWLTLYTTRCSFCRKGKTNFSISHFFYT